MPRPVLVPLAVWLLLRDPRLRLPTLALVIAHFVAAAAMGLLDDWIRTAVIYASTNQIGIGPSRVLGIAGLLIGIPIATWLAWRGRMGWAGLAMSGYLLPQYLLVLLFESRPPEARAATDTNR